MAIDQLSSRFSTDAASAARDARQRRSEGRDLAAAATANAQAIFGALKTPDAGLKRVNELVASAKAAAVAAETTTPDPTAATQRVKSVEEMLAGVRFTSRSADGATASPSSPVGVSQTGSSPSTPANVPVAGAPDPAPVAEEPPAGIVFETPTPVASAPPPVATAPATQPVGPAAAVEPTPATASPTQPTGSTSGASGTRGSTATPAPAPAPTYNPPGPILGWLFNRRA